MTELFSTLTELFKTIHTLMVTIALFILPFVIIFLIIYAIVKRKRKNGSQSYPQYYYTDSSYIENNKNKPNEEQQKTTEQNTTSQLQQPEREPQKSSNVWESIFGGYIQPQITYAGHYQAKYILTRNEWYAYKKLKQYVAIHDLVICPKVRLLDIVEPRRGDPNYMSYMGKIKSKHVDFVICDQDLHIKGILELDDNSHNQKERQERDRFVDEILTSVGYKVIRTRGITENTLDPITAPKTEQSTGAT